MSRTDLARALVAKAKANARLSAEARARKKIGKAQNSSEVLTWYKAFVLKAYPELKEDDPCFKFSAMHRTIGVKLLEKWGPQDLYVMLRLFVETWETRKKSRGGRLDGFPSLRFFAADADSYYLETKRSGTLIQPRKPKRDRDEFKPEEPKPKKETGAKDDGW